MNPVRKAVIGVAMVGATLTGGALGATLLNGAASAQTGTTVTTPDPGGATRDPSVGGHVANGITEAVLTGDVADKVKAAALAAVPGGTIERVENDAEGAVYEAHMTKADGTHATVKLDASFIVTSTEAGHK